ncbi:uncharacterized protein LOC124162208 isoform X1 [Ischnura elegans]|uniref:uncharacterized protein LOC124162208 isoform X1 n=1 Tax=Ischnura elegans TaxID=197161 RepID=UPI001ED8B670|nr:uncharacterized protein LOC124162208 isoform X1 [Ischnura elegans]
MPASGPVYQPTTVSYEQQSDWTPTGYLSQTVSSSLPSRGKCLQWLVLAIGVLTFAAGLIMAVEGAIDYENQARNFEDNPPLPSLSSPLPPAESPPSHSVVDLVVAIFGALLMVIGIVMIMAYVQMVRKRKRFMLRCLATKEQTLVRQLRDNQVQNGQILTLGPSTTDLLLTAQYGPVSEIAYQPPIVVEEEEEETRTLMGSENKEWLELNDGELEDVCLKEGTKQAPLAAEEEVTPSLRSSLTLAGSAFSLDDRGDITPLAQSRFSLDTAYSA